MGACLEIYHWSHNPKFRSIVLFFILLHLAMSSQPPSYSNPDPRAVAIVGACIFHYYTNCFLHAHTTPLL
jgi:hypothetical protein